MSTICSRVTLTFATSRCALRSLNDQIKYDAHGVAWADQFHMSLVTCHSSSIHEASEDTKQIEVVTGIIADISHFKGIPFHSFLCVVHHHEVYK